MRLDRDDPRAAAALMEEARQFSGDSPLVLIDAYELQTHTGDAGLLITYHRQSATQIGERVLHETRFSIWPAASGEGRNGGVLVADWRKPL